MNKTYVIHTRNGLLGDSATEWWTQEDYDEWARTVEQMKRDGTYMKPVTYHVTLQHNPLYDDVPAKSIDSFRFDILDFSK